MINIFLQFSFHECSQLKMVPLDDSNLAANRKVFFTTFKKCFVFQIFTIAVSGNISNYLQSANKAVHWRYDFHLVSYAATAITCYVWLVPLALWAAIKWTTTQAQDEEAIQVKYLYHEVTYASYKTIKLNNLGIWFYTLLAFIGNFILAYCVK